MHVLLFDDPAIRPHLLPFTFTRPVAALRCGILTLAEKWQRHLAAPTVGYLTQPYLQAKFPVCADGVVTGPALIINGACAPMRCWCSKYRRCNPARACIVMTCW